ncbi:Na+/H+ antiporter subunit E [Mycobacterium sp. UM_Kg27]|uniref:Na+/H+ antiporter subunit E n=1 Tax=Mycobacterium sp. UM_Kg27 TaxID=1545693 RepID=UPI000A77ECE3|nr:Na+/H+ antiporter subunit E [Mycobacterium sp. UM_Kg27]
MSAVNSPLTGVLGETLLWWLATGAVWVVTLTARTTQELFTAAVCTLPCAVAARAARRANGGNWRFRPAWLRWAPAVASELLAQPAQVWAYVLIPSRRPQATVGSVTLPREPAAVAAARSAAATMTLATTPGTVVLDAAAHSVRVHRVGQRPGALERVVQR